MYFLSSKVKCSLRKNTQVNSVLLRITFLRVQPIFEERSECSKYRDLQLSNMPVPLKRFFLVLMAFLAIAALSFVIKRSYIQFNAIVSIRNTQWQRVHVQVRKGYKQDPENDKLIFDQDLALGQSRTFTVTNGDDIVYRRDADPAHADGKHFTRWSYANCGDSRNCVINNP